MKTIRYSKSGRIIEEKEVNIFLLLEEFVNNSWGHITKPEDRMNIIRLEIANTVEEYEAEKEYRRKILERISYSKLNET